MLLAAFLLCSNFIKAQIYADSVIASKGVNNPEHAVSGNSADFAIISTGAGVDNVSRLKLGFTPLGMAGMFCAVTVQQVDGNLSADVLQTLRLELYDSKERVIAEHDGFNPADVELLQGATDKYRVIIHTDEDAKDVASVRIVLKGLADADNKLRIYNALLNYPCSGYRADSVLSFSNVENPQHAVTHQKKDYALLAPPISSKASLVVTFPNVTDNGRTVKFILGEDSTPLKLSLLKNIKLSIYDEQGNVLAEQNHFTLADADVLDGGKFSLNISVAPGSAHQIKSAGVKLTGSLNVLTTLRVYNATLNNVNQFKRLLYITPSGALTVCKADSIELTAKPPYKDENILWQWYKNNKPVTGATQRTYTATVTGDYFVTATTEGGCADVSDEVSVNKTSCDKNAGVIVHSLQVYPNPFNAYTVVTLRNITVESTITVSDKTGIVIQTVKANGGQQVRLLENAQKGFYLIKVVTADGNVYSAKVIKQ